MPLDRLLYAAGQPAAADVRGLFDNLRGQLERRRAGGGGAPREPPSFRLPGAGLFPVRARRRGPDFRRRRHPGWQRQQPPRPARAALLAARLYLESRGAAVELLDRPPTAAGLGGPHPGAGRTLPARLRRRLAGRHRARTCGGAAGWSTAIRPACVDGQERLLREELGLERAGPSCGDFRRSAPWAWKPLPRGGLPARARAGRAAARGRSRWHAFNRAPPAPEERPGFLPRRPGAGGAGFRLPAAAARQACWCCRRRCSRTPSWGAPATPRCSSWCWPRRAGRPGFRRAAPRHGQNRGGLEQRRPARLERFPAAGSCCST